jgi:streptomycin 6-kinase
VTTPAKMRRLRDYPGGSEWIDSLPRLLRECEERWSLRLGEPYEYAFVSLAVRAERPDGTPVVLKIGFPHRESEHEPDALAHYDGRGAVRLLDVDRERRAMLLERCEPGTPLLDLPDEREAYSIAADILRRLWRPVAPGHAFRPISEDAARWAVVLPERWEQLSRPFERILLDEAVAAFEDLAPTQGELVVCHQDFHRANVLRAEREPWLAIDPKPVAAEREFDTGALIRDQPGDVGWRLDFLAAELGLDRERVRRWALAHTLAWSFDESDPDEKDLEVVRALVRA